MRRIYKKILPVLILLVALTGFAANQYDDVYFLIKKNFTIFSEVYKEVALRYVDEVDPEKLMRKGISAMLDALDPYTVLIDESQNQRLDIITKGSYGGVGIEVGYKRGKVVVIAPVEGYSAHKKGIRAGDIILSVDGLSLENLSADEVQNIMYGEPGSEVTVKIKRYGLEEPLTFTLKRERVEIKNVSYAGLIGPDDEIGYIILSRFSQNTAEEIRNAILEFQKNNETKGLILDLRNNPGGLLQEAVETVDKFVEPGTEVVRTKGRLPEHNSVFKTDEPAIFKDKPVIVLQNQGSASASEVVAGAFQDLDRAVIVGEQSFGKGLVQIVKPLSYNTALKITASKYYTPSGRSIQSLTYTHDDDNSVLVNADSTKKAFKTRSGRTVYEGEGIIPDIKIDSEVQNRLQMALARESHYFFFANRYASEIDSLVKPEKSQLLKEFKTYLENQDFDYKSRSEELLEQLEAEFEKGMLESGYKNKLNELRNMVSKEKKKEFERQEDLIYRKLYNELLSRFENTADKIDASTKTDPYIQRGVDLIENSSAYKQLLTPDN